MEALSYCQLMERMLAAEARVMELAAENVGLKNFIYNDCLVYKDFMGELDDADKHKPETPTTDRIVVSIKADAVEEVLKIMGGFSSDECGDSVYFDVRDFAQQLRESAK